MPSTPSETDGSQGFTSRLMDLGFRLLPAIGGAIGFAGFVALIGGAIEWVRFNSVGLPANQAVHVIPRGELIADGAWTLAIFILLGIFAVLLAYVCRRGAFGSPFTGFVILTAAESLVVAYMIAHGTLVVVWFAIAIALALALFWWARSRDAMTAIPRMARWLDSRELKSAEARWTTANNQVKRYEIWRERLTDSRAPTAVLSDAERKLEEALRAQARAEDRWEVVVDRLKKRYEA